MNETVARTLESISCEFAQAFYEFERQPSPKKAEGLASTMEDIAHELRKLAHGLRDPLTVESDEFCFICIDFILFLLDKVFAHARRLYYEKLKDHFLEKAKTMPKQAKCPHCGLLLSAPPNWKMRVCRWCGTRVNFNVRGHYYPLEAETVYRDYWYTRARGGLPPELLLGKVPDEVLEGAIRWKCSGRQPYEVFLSQLVADRVISVEEGEKLVGILGGCSVWQLERELKRRREWFV